MILYIIMHTLYDVINDDNNIIIICNAIKISQNIKVYNNNSQMDTQRQLN